MLPLPAESTEWPNNTVTKMATLKLVTWNVRGLRAKPQRLAVLSYLKQMRADISVIVEIHITGQMQMALKKPWVGWVYQAPYTNNSRGIAILIAKTVQFWLHGLRSDLQGGFLLLHASVGGLEVLLLAFYIPTPFQFAVLKEGVTFMTQHPTVPAILLGDFNMVIDPYLDRLHPPITPPTQPTPTRFGRFLLEFAMTDSWRLKHPTTLAYSCYTPSQAAISRIDMIMLSSPLAVDLLTVGFGAGAFALLGYSPSALRPSTSRLEVEPILAYGSP